MQISKGKLKKIIKEELGRFMETENPGLDDEAAEVMASLMELPDDQREKVLQMVQAGASLPSVNPTA
jgi:hypothetical protein